MNAWITAFLDTVQSVDPWLRTLIAGVAIMLETSVLLGLVVPGDTVVIVAATGIEDAAQWGALVAACIVGALLGESFGFAIGRWLGPRIDVWLARRWPRAAVRWSRVERYLRRRGGPAILLSRFLPVAHSLVPLVVGTSGMRYRRFMAWTAPACAVWALAYASVGWLAAGSFRELSDRLHGAGYLFVAIIAAFLVVAWLAKRWLLRRESRHMD
ncbi:MULTISPECIES: DedA family protein [unclassified Agrococcus]|uniref:DedA family protein n=1 Tax=unclassified Agrococcus TaxID=2615065 RepID=UPI00361768FF